MRLAFCLFKYFPYGGLQKKFMRIARACQLRGHEIDVYTMSWEGENPYGFNVSEYPPKGHTNAGRCAYFVKQMKTHLIRNNYDLVVGFNRMPGLDVYYGADICFKEAAGQKHGAWYQHTPRYKVYKTLEEMVFGPDADTKIMLISELQKEAFMKHFPCAESRIQLLPPGISHRYKALPDADESRTHVCKALNVPKDEKVVLMVGSGFKTKGVDRALYALASLPEELQLKTTIAIIGQGKPWFYMQLARRLKVLEQVKFLGPSDDITPYLQAANLLLHPAIYESAGNILIEAMVCGTPILTTESCGYSSHVQKAHAGLVLPKPFNQDALNEKFNEMLSADDTSTWARNGEQYTSKVDVYSLPDRAADLILN